MMFTVLVICQQVEQILSAAILESAILVDKGVQRSSVIYVYRIRVVLLNCVDFMVTVYSIFIASIYYWDQVLANLDEGNFVANEEGNQRVAIQDFCVLVKKIQKILINKEVFVKEVEGIVVN